jgi:hypothetical protein
MTELVHWPQIIALWCRTSAEFLQPTLVLPVPESGFVALDLEMSLEDWCPEWFPRPVDAFPKRGESALAFRIAGSGAVSSAHCLSFAGHSVPLEHRKDSDRKVWAERFLEAWRDHVVLRADT